MSLSNYKNINSLININEIDEEIFSLQKELFNLKVKTRTNQNKKVHLFTHTKRRIAQLKFKRLELLKYSKIL